MNQVDRSRRVLLTIPAEKAYVPVAAMALSGLGMMAGLDVDLLGDLRTVTSESLDCLMHQAGLPRAITICAGVEEGRLHVCFASEERSRVGDEDALGLDITRGVLETLMPEVCLVTDNDGVHRIECSMPV